MFKNVFIEKGLESDLTTKNILANIKFDQIKSIGKVEDVWGKVKKPYLQKRETLNLFIGQKRGQLVKEAPDAY